VNLHDPELIDLLYLLAAALFIVGLRRLGSPRTARSGNTIAGVGMGIGLGATLLMPGFDFTGTGFVLIVVGVLVGTIAGVWSARAVKMTAMPQMVAFFNGLGGGCVALISLAEYHHFADLGASAYGLVPNVTLVGITAGALIGSVSFTGSIVAFGKLQELISGRPVTWPLQRAINALLLATGIVLAALLVTGSEGSDALMLALVAVAAVLGVTFVLPIGGADMPVIISLLNSLTGLAACAAGFALGNTLLIVAGIIVGASGFLLTKMMGEAMNRTIGSVLFGAFGAAGGSAGSTHEGTVRSATAEDVAIMLAYSRRVVIVPGYGLAVAQAQHTVRELAELLGSMGVNVLFGIHPVAGRMPGHMNVLLAEANVPYDQLKEMEEVNPEFKQTDVVLVIGANDVVNPSARDEPGSPLYGMPVLNVDEAKAVVVMKRGMATGFAGVDNPLFVAPNTQMLFGDAKASLAALVTAVGEL
jgi:NAD(P) transhydrogenase subunit beta